MSKYEFTQLHNRGEDWMVRQYVMRARFAEQYARKLSASWTLPLVLDI